MNKLRLSLIPHIHPSTSSSMTLSTIDFRLNYDSMIPNINDIKLTLD